MNGLTLLVLIALAVGVFVAWRAGRIAGRREARIATVTRSAGVPAAPATAVTAPIQEPPVSPDHTTLAPIPDQPPALECAPIDAERARITLALEADNARLRSRIADLDARRVHLEELCEDRRSLLVALADARAETARYRALVVEAENNAPSNLLDGPGSPDDLKLIVGIGPMLERMLHQLGVTTYRQMAHWNERDVDEIDAKLPEFPGRIRRDQWVVQARALHRSKYGDAP